MLLGLLSGCAKKQSSSRLEAPVEEALSGPSCEYSYLEGDSALPLGSESSLQPSLMAFGKKFDLHRFRRLGTLSGRGTAVEVARQGVRLFQVPYQEACPFFDELARAPADFEQFWRTEQERSREGERILGLFVERGDPDFPSSSRGPIIGVRSDTHRGILLHEYAHYLFSERVITDGGRTSWKTAELYAQRLQSLRSTDAALRDRSWKPTEEEARSKVLEMAQLLQLGAEILIRYLLEEVAIVDLMEQEFEAGRIRYVPNMSRAHAWYLKKSADRALERIRDLLSLGSRVEGEAFSLYPSLVQAGKELNDARSRLEGLRTELQVILARYPAPEVQAFEALRAGGEEPTPICGHGDGFPSEHTDSR